MKVNTGNRTSFRMNLTTSLRLGVMYGSYEVAKKMLLVPSDSERVASLHILVHAIYTFVSEEIGKNESVFSVCSINKPRASENLDNPMPYWQHFKFISGVHSIDLDAAGIIDISFPNRSINHGCFSTN